MVSTPSLQVWVPYLPPSSNKIYIRHPSGKGRILSSEARTFKVRTMETIQKEGAVALIKFEKNVPYELRLSIFFETLTNKTSSVGDKYKQMDLSNRVKLVEDVVSDATGIDDRHNFRLVVEKHCDPTNTGILVGFKQLPLSDVGLTKEQYEQRYQDTVPPSERLRVDRTVRTEQHIRHTPWPKKRNPG